MPIAELDAITESSVDLLREFERTGRPEPFEAFMRRHASMVYATCLKVTRDPHDAEDATQATFLTLASKSRLNGEIRQPEAWLRKVAHRLALDLIRSKKRRVNRENVRSEMNGEAAPLDSHDHADAGEMKGILNEELAKLPASYRMPLILHYFGGLTRDEMAAQLKLKPSTLGVRLHRAREQLRRRLAGRGVALPAVALTALLTEVVRGSVCSHMMASTAQQASAIALGHAALPAMYANTGGGGFTSINAVLGLLSHAKIKVMLSALIVTSAISLTSAQVQRFLPAVLRGVLPTFRLPSLVPRFDFSLPTPTLLSQAPTAATREARIDTTPDAVQAVTFAPIGETRLGTPSTASAVPSAVAPPQNSSRIAGGSSLTSASTPAKRIDVLDFAAPVRVATSVGRTQSSGALPSTPVAIGHAPSPNHPTKSTPDVPAVATGRPPSAEAGADPWNNVIPSHNADVSGPAVPDAASVASTENVPDRVLASSAGGAPPLQSYSGSGGGAGGGGAIANSTPTGPASAAQHVAPPHPVGSSTGGSLPLLASRTTVFTGTSANYGGYADASWKPTELTDLNGTLDDATSTGAGYSFDNASSKGPAIPGESLSINGARLTLHNTSSAGTLNVSFVDTSATNIPTLPAGHHFIGVWQLDSSAAFASADLLVRYDDLRAARLNLNERILKLWVSDGTAWKLMWLDPTFGRDVDANLLWVTAAGDFKFFAVSAPEPAAAAVVAAGATLILRRRRR